MTVEASLRALASAGAVVRFIVEPESAIRVTLVHPRNPDDRVTATNPVGDSDVIAVLVATADEALAEMRALDARLVLRVVG